MIWSFLYFPCFLSSLFSVSVCLFLSLSVLDVHGAYLPISIVSFIICYLYKLWEWTDGCNCTRTHTNTDKQTRSEKTMQKTYPGSLTCVRLYRVFIRSQGVISITDQIEEEAKGNIKKKDSGKARRKRILVICRYVCTTENIFVLWNLHLPQYLFKIILKYGC